MIADIIYKVCKLEKRIKQLEKEKTPVMSEDCGLLLQGHSYTTNCNTFVGGGKKAIIILTSPDVQVYADTADKSFSARGFLCIPLLKGENKIEITCLAVANDVNCTLITKIIDLG